MAVKKHTKLWEWQKRLRKEKAPCKRCGTVTYLTVDHKIPKYLLEQLGLNDAIYEDERNFQALCHPCNIFKGSKIDLADKDAIELLKQYINSL